MIRFTVGKYRWYWDRSGKEELKGVFYLFSPLERFSIQREYPNRGPEFSLCFIFVSGEMVRVRFPASDRLMDRMQREIEQELKKSNMIDLDDLVETNSDIDCTAFKPKKIR
jgi:hypothetical protein